MSTQRRLSPIDKLIINADRALATLSPGAVKATRTTPAQAVEDSELSAEQARHTAGLMRINHSGEVCAQALYQGQALTARDPEVREAMQQSAQEEEDHLAWCEQRLTQLNSRTSYLNPLWYGLSFGIGATAGIIGDRWSLGFVAATEDQVCKHLQAHLEELPEQDGKSRAIIEQMLIDEAEHATKALEAGGVRFPAPVKKLMTSVSRVMTGLTYRI